MLDIVSGTYSHWVSDYTNSTTYLEPGDFAFVNVTITTPEEADVGDYAIVIEVTSIGDDTIYKTLTTITHVLPLRDIELETAESNQDVTPHLTGSKVTVQYSVTIRNTGTAADTFETSRPGGWKTGHWRRSTRVWPRRRRPRP